MNNSVQHTQSLDLLGRKLNRNTLRASLRVSPSSIIKNNTSPGSSFVPLYTGPFVDSYHHPEDRNRTSDVCQYYANSLNILGKSIGLEEIQILELSKQLDNILTPKQKENARLSVLISPTASILLEELVDSTKRLMSDQIKVKEVVKIQKHIRRYLVMKKLRAYSKKELRRIRIRNVKYNQLLELEQDYSSRLMFIVHYYLIPLRKNMPKGVLAGDIAEIFSNVEELSELHALLLKKMLSIIHNENEFPFISGIGNCFLDVMDGLSGIYINYAENHHVGMMTLQRLCDQNPKFASFIDEVNTQKSLNLKELLSLPLDYFSKYEMKMNGIVSTSSPKDKGYEQLIAATMLIQQTSLKIAKIFDDSYRIAQIIAVQRKIESDKPLNLTGSSERKFIKEGSVYRVDDKKNCNLFLFSDLLLVTEPTHHDLNKFLFSFELINSSVIDHPNKDTKYSFSIKNSSREISITLKSGPEKAFWLADLLIIIDSFQRKKVFGVPLATVLENEEREIPYVMERTITYIKEHGKDVEGIFRVPGDNVVIFEFKRAFDTGRGDTIDFAKCSVHDVCGVLKLFLREFPEPLFPFSIFNSLITVQRNYDEFTPSSLPSPCEKKSNNSESTTSEDEITNAENSITTNNNDDDNNGDVKTRKKKKKSKSRREKSEPKDKIKVFGVGDFDASSVPDLDLSDPYNQALMIYLQDLAFLIFHFLPITNQRVFKYLFDFLYDISKANNVTKMDARNLAVVFTPNIIRPETDSINSALLSPQITKIVNSILDYYLLFTKIIIQTESLPVSQITVSQSTQSFVNNKSKRVSRSSSISSLTQAFTSAPQLPTEDVIRSRKRSVKFDKPFRVGDTPRGDNTTATTTTTTTTHQPSTRRDRKKSNSDKGEKQGAAPLEKKQLSRSDASFEKLQKLSDKSPRENQVVKHNAASVNNNNNNNNNVSSGNHNSSNSSNSNKAPDDDKSKSRRASTISHVKNKSPPISPRGDNIDDEDSLKRKVNITHSSEMKIPDDLNAIIVKAASKKKKEKKSKQKD